MLVEQIQNDLTNARKSQNKLVASLLSTVWGELQRISDGKPMSLDENKVVKLLSTMVANMDEVIKVAKGDAVEKAKAEKEILKPYLPEVMSEDEVMTAVQKAIADTGATTKKDIGKIMAELKKYGPSLDMKLASGFIGKILN